MIPKIIHYCWFGRTEKPKEVLEYIETWKQNLPDFEIREWNEDNFDVNIIPYTQEAYEAKKYAFVSDYARFWILYHHGGLYFDTDVEVIKDMDDIIARGSFMGREAGAFMMDSGNAVAPGLGIGVVSGLSLYKRLLEKYENIFDQRIYNTEIQSYAKQMFFASQAMKEDALDNSVGQNFVFDM